MYNTSMYPGLFCNAPFRSLMIDSEGDCYFCGSTYGKGMPSLGNVLEKTDILEEIWNGERAQEFRRSIFDSTFKYCYKGCSNLLSKNGWVVRIKSEYAEDNICGTNDCELEILKNRLLKIDHTPKNIILSQKKCNLKCPSCRSTFITNERLSTEKNMKLEQIRRPLIRAAEQLVLGYTGEVTLNEINTKLLQTATLNDLPKIQTISIQTNGLLFDKQYWDKISDYVKTKIGKIEISIDAASKETYDKNRPGGNWENVIENIKYLASVKVPLIQINFCVRDNNYFEIPILIEMAEQIGCKVNLQQIKNWGTYSEEQFMYTNIFDKRHKNYFDFIKVLNSACFKKECVFHEFSSEFMSGIPN